MKFLYSIFISIFAFLMKVGALFNKKLSKGILGRKESLAKVKSAIKTNDKVIWMHAASLGEYEQGLPVLEKLKTKFPNYKLLVTFFSPSGYDNVSKKNTLADVLCYLPFDKKKEIETFVNAVHPSLFFTVKYDYWYHLFEGLKKIDCPIYVVSALFYPEQVFFKPYGKWMVAQLKKYVDCFFHQTETSFSWAKQIGLHNGIVAGDTRFDRVKQIKNRNNFVEFIKEFKQDKPLFVFGSSWEVEENIALELKSSVSKIIIAPHDLKRVDYLKKIFPNALLYSSLKEFGIKDYSTHPILIIDNIGLLSRIYSYSDVAVVGGGFHSKGLHNILEAATFGVPVLFGSHYRKNPEADALVQFGGAQSFSKELDMVVFIKKLLSQPTEMVKMGQKASEFIESQPNSTAIILDRMVNYQKML
ncbi:MAG: 3-deoxy-D-manno-octulosonic acid transferase [Bacteroidetes bacterium]|nr:3-deoxy-D-manno-octulosonic acid transferase [Bacteroidota bacterium]